MMSLHSLLNVSDHVMIPIKKNDHVMICGGWSRCPFFLAYLENVFCALRLSYLENVVVYLSWFRADMRVSNSRSFGY